MSKLCAIILAILMACAAVCAQTASQTQPQPQPPAGGIPQSAPPIDRARQMELDLNQMESLLNNMAAQVSFIRDTNMSILLNTNVQLWSVLIRDLRLQLQEQQRHPASENINSPQRHGDTEKK